MAHNTVICVALAALVIFVAQKYLMKSYSQPVTFPEETQWEVEVPTSTAFGGHVPIRIDNGEVLVEYH